MDGEVFDQIVRSVTQKTGYQFSYKELFDVSMHTARKLRRLGKDEDYAPLLLENELRDYVSRRIINQIGGARYAHA